MLVRARNKLKGQAMVDSTFPMGFILIAGATSVLVWLVAISQTLPPY